MTSHLLNPLTFPLHGSRLIEAIGRHRQDLDHRRAVRAPGAGPRRRRQPLRAPAAAGRHPGDDVYPRRHARTVEPRARAPDRGGRVFSRRTGDIADPFLRRACCESYPDESERQKAAHRLMLAAETMDEAAIFTIDAWCQRMLREHAFDSGSLFDEELVSDEQALFEDAAHDYWRQQVYPLDAAGAGRAAGLLARRRGAEERRARAGAPRRHAGRGGRGTAVGADRARSSGRWRRSWPRLKAGWVERVDAMAALDRRPARAPIPSASTASR